MLLNRFRAILGCLLLIALFISWCHFLAFFVISLGLLFLGCFFVPSLVGGDNGVGVGIDVVDVTDVDVTDVVDVIDVDCGICGERGETESVS